MDNNTQRELKIIKVILWTYIILCFVIAGLNYGYAPNATPAAAKVINWIWHFYENWIKTLFIVICSYLTLRIVGTSKRITMRKKNMLGFITSALIVHILSPLFLHNKELYFFVMPLPWTTTSLQLLYPDSSFYLSRFPVWGAAGVSAALIFCLVASVVIIIGTLLFGRRWQCSTLCLFNGFASEVFAPAFPLIGKNKKVKPKTLKLFTILKWFFLMLAIFFTAWWILFLSGIQIVGDFETISKIEEYKYLTAELLMAMFFWMAFIGRGYCYYCPLGTIVSFLGKLAGQRITTNKASCIRCSQCNQACPMSIDISSKAQVSQEILAGNCTGCGHCIDACPTRTLSYTTRFMDRYQSKETPHRRSHETSV